MTEQENITEPQKSKAASKTDRLGTAGIGKLLFEFTIPCIAMSVFNSLYNLIDAAVL